MAAVVLLLSLLLLLGLVLAASFAACGDGWIS